jgi:hypothetical protein
VANYLLIYKGGNQAESPEAGQAVMQAWMNWFGQLGESVVDGGNPTSMGATIAPNGSVSEGGASGVAGYSVLAAGSLQEATEKAKGCPHLQSGGTVEVYETFNPM